jgi:hypothetical protein
MDHEVPPTFELLGPRKREWAHFLGSYSKSNFFSANRPAPLASMDVRLFGGQQGQMPRVSPIWLD